MPNNFFGSKLNSVLLLILIVLMIFALRIMLKDKATYLPVLEQNTPVSQIEGNKEDLVSFSIKPGEEVTGKADATGALKGGYFFEGNVPISILDSSKNVLKTFGGQATTDWMTAEVVYFSVLIDFTNIPLGKAYIRIMQDDPSGGESGRPIKFILIPIVIK